MLNALHKQIKETQMNTQNTNLG